ncbi:unnamed protein product [Phytophthora lilii]|uniref:Unnamed protein product n=1 Tax=Phytophthora lilii TaxID=2077276 RepID=A0A9W6X8Q0_9STRA|nr:unnamed protein product [Phytophthora lilii]
MQSLSSDQTIQESSLAFKPLMASLNVNPMGAVLIPSRPTSSSATASAKQRRLLTSAKTARGGESEREVMEKQPMSARDRYYVEQRATTAPGGRRHKHHLRPPVISGGNVEDNENGKALVRTPEYAVVEEENNHTHRGKFIEMDTLRRGDLLSRRHEVKTLTEKLADELTQQADFTSSGGGPANSYGMSTPGGAVPRDSFFYLRRVDSNPYNLEVTNHSRINPKDYYTVSQLGVTHFDSGGVEFVSLRRFERENYIYSLLIKQAVSSRKRVDAFVSLNNNLFILLPHLHDALLQVRNACLDLQKIQLFDFEHLMGPGEASAWAGDTSNVPQQKTFSLAEFSLRLKAQKIRVERVVDHFISDFEMTAKHACENYLYSFLQSTGFNDIKPAGSFSDVRRKSSAAGPQRKESVINHEDNRLNEQKPMTYTERATMRTQCRRITKFLRVVEFLVSDALLRMAISSTVLLKEGLMTFIRDLDDDYDDISSAEKSRSGELKANLTLSTLSDKAVQPLFRIDVALKRDSVVRLSSRPRLVNSNAESGFEPGERKAAISDFGDPMDLLEFSPSTEPLRSQLETLVFNGLMAVTNRERLIRNSMFKVYVEASMDDGAQGGDGDDESSELSSENMDLDILIMEDATFVETLQSINSIVHDAFEQAEENCEELSVFLERYQENAFFCKDISEPTRYLETDVHDFRGLLDKYIQEVQDIDAVAETAPCGLLLLDRAKLNSFLKPSPRKCLDGLFKLIPIVFRLLNENLTDEFTTTNDRISTIPTTVEEYSDSLAFLRELQSGQEQMDEKYHCVRSLFHLLEEYRIKMTDTDQMNAFVLTQKRSQLKASVDLFENSCEQYTAKFSVELEARLPGLVSKLAVVSNALSNGILFDLKSDINETIAFLTSVEGEITQLENAVKQYYQYEKTLGLPQSDAFEELANLKSDLALKIEMWMMFREWNGVLAVWEKQQFPDEIDFTSISEQVEHFYNQILNWEQNLSEGMGPLCAHLKAGVEEYRVTMPILTDLRCPSFEERHYSQLRDLLGFGIRHLGLSRTSTSSPVLTLGELVQMHLSPFGAQINRIATEAAQERLLKDMLTKIVGLWERLEFDVKMYKEFKEYYVLTSIETIYTKLEESLVSMTAVLSSKFLSPIKDLAVMWHKRLLLFQETFDAWIECQRKWMHLETIFSAPDIQKQLPSEGAVFMGVNQFWKDLMRRTRDQRSCLKVTGAILIGTSSGSKTYKDSGTGSTGGGGGVGQALLDSLNKHNSSLDRIEKSLEDYLEMKRRSFPRFYFISNDELLEMLAHAKEPQVVQRHLPKCFDALVKLDINDDNTSNSGVASSIAVSQDIVAMISPEGERVAFGRNIKARGNIEDWLNAVLVNMKTTLHRHVKSCLGDYQHSSRETWLFRHPAQTVAVVSYIIWAKECEFCFRSRSQDPVRELSLWYQTICSQLSNLTRLVRTSLTTVQRRVVVSMVTTDVHFRDIVESLVTKKVVDEDDFLWEQQLRYQWYAEYDACEILQANCRIKYGYEYMGACTRLVITPLTDRCWMTVTGALELRYGAAPSGPAGTGKTETSRDLAKALGILCIVINCSSQMSYKMMGSIFNGVIQAGTWVCLDEFNRIDIEVLSVVGQQMSVLRNARLMNAEDLILDGQLVPLREHHVIVTMNPGYVGRTELPNNLKVSFRPVAMMVPDYALIAEILLFAEGFQLAKPLSRKVTKLYKLCSEQLSKQTHYDFGMRAVRTVLTMACLLKRSLTVATSGTITSIVSTPSNGIVADSSSSFDENIILIKAMVGANTPKLTDEDTRLFHGIVKDLFPDTLSSLGFGECDALLAGVGGTASAVGSVNFVATLEEEINEQLRRDNLQNPHQWTKKILQLFATLEVRLGVVQIGATGSGKSTSLRTLKTAVTALRERAAHPDTRFQRVISYTLNPKAISMIELYGFFHPVTHEWTDGLASNLLRTCIMEKNEEMLARHYANQAVGISSDPSTWNLPFYWINFDGPIDVHWIESMNTVLDDNMTLCLANGERIRLLPKIQLLFEVADTSAASPATISRLGMVYYHPSYIGWLPFVETWASKLTVPVTQPLVSPSSPIHSSMAKEALPPAPLNGKIKAKIIRYFELFVEPGLSFVRSSTSLGNTSPRIPLATCDLAFVATICHIFQALLAQRAPPELFGVSTPVPRENSANAEDPSQQDVTLSLEDQRHRCMDLMFIYSFAWSIGGNLNLDQHKSEFKDFLYKLITANEQHLSPDILAVDGKIPTPAGLSQATGDIQDFFIDFQYISFSPWANAFVEQSQQIQQSSRIIGGRLLVPTLEILKYRYLVELMTIDCRQPVFLTGATGSGKSTLINHILDVHARIAADIDPSDFDANSFLSVIAHGKVLPLVLNLSAQTSSDSAQLSIESKFAKKRRTLLGAPVNKQLVVIFVDDVNMPSTEKHGAQPVIELLRQYLEFEGFYDREKFFWKDVKDSVLIAAGGLPGAGRQTLCPRFVRHFSAVFCVPSCDEAAMKAIFNSILASHITSCGGTGAFAKNVKDALQQTANATCELFQRIVQGLLPTPSKCHYTFNLRDVTKLMQGIVLGTRGFAASSIKVAGPQPTSGLTVSTVVSLWAHESIRVFRDRLIDNSDRKWFSEQLVEIANSNFGLSWNLYSVFVTEEEFQMHSGDESSVKQTPLHLLFSPRRVDKVIEPSPTASVIKYDQVGDLERYEAFLNGQVLEYNSCSLTTSVCRPPLDLVLFEDAMVHTAAIARILVQPRGHAMLLGMGGCGKRSLARLAVFMIGYHCFEIEMKKDYGLEEFRKDLKMMMKLAALGVKEDGYTKGAKSKSGRSTRTISINTADGTSNLSCAIPTIFLINDSQLVSDSFLEDINTILNGGDIPKLFASDELERIISDVRTLLERITSDIKSSQATQGQSDETLTLGDFTRKDCEDYFHSMVQNSLHFVICMNPLGDAFRSRVRQFPALINCTTIDYFNEWPKRALEYVAEFYLSQEPTKTRLKGRASAVSTRATAPDVANSPVIRSALVELCVEAHQSTCAAIPRFQAECKRQVYITSQHYLDLITLFRRIYRENKARWETKLQRLMTGVVKLEETNSLVSTLQDELVTLQPVLVSKTKEAEELLCQVAIDQAEAELVAQRVGSDEALVKEQQQEVAACQADAQRDLDQALPALNAAVAALDSLDKKDITEVKGFVKPPQAVQVVMEAVCIMLGEKADWDNSKRILSRSTFMTELKEYDKDNISVSILKKIRKYIENPEFAVDEVKKVSHAAMSLCMWVHAVDTYARVFREVAPKRQRLAEMNLVLASANTKLAAKQHELAKVMERVCRLKENCDATLAEKQRLIEESELTQQRLQNAEKLTVGLNDERIRWKGSIKLLKQEGNAILGDAFLTAAYMAYLGPFNGLFRNKLLSRWAETATSSISVSSPFALASVYGDIRELREWQLLGLPSDSFSTDTAICVLKSKQRWALMIDPQEQAMQWIKRLETPNHLETVKSDDPCLMQVVEECLCVGKPLLIEDVTELLDPSLEPLFAVKQPAYARASTKTSCVVQVKIEDRLVDANIERFRLYLTTKLANPHFAPDVFIRVNVVNFTVTSDGLEEQLLSEVVQRERIEVEERKHTLLASIAQDQKQLQDIEIKILNLLSDAKGNILDDVELIQTLETSKQTSTVVAQRLAESEVTKREVLEIRNQYQGVAVRGALLFFVIAGLVKIDPMYQYSLEYFTRLFNISLHEAPAKRNLSERLESLKHYLTLSVYRNICRGLFKAHKQLFAFVICLRIMINANELVAHDIYLLDKTTVQGEISTSEMIDAKPATNASVEELDVDSEVMSSTQVIDACFLVLAQRSPIFKRILDSYYRDRDAWNAWVNTTNPYLSRLPGDWETALSCFSRLCIIRWLREDVFTTAVRYFIEQTLGSDFLEIASSRAQMSDIYSDIDKSTPCLFILSPGADPISTLERQAREKGIGEDRCHVVSLGQGQGPIVESKLEECKQQGFWLVLQNVHLAKSWLPRLQSQLLCLKQEVRSGGVHEDFRLFLASFPVAYFPITILQNSVKVMTESPMGIKANLQRSMTLFKQLNTDLDNVTDASMVSTSNTTMKLRLAFGLSFFHAVVRERSKFGTLGWNLMYDFSDADFVSVVTLQRRLLDGIASRVLADADKTSTNQHQSASSNVQQPTGASGSHKQVPWDALLFLAGEIYYGGRVTDEFDRRCLMAVLRRFCSEASFTQKTHTTHRSDSPVRGLSNVLTPPKNASMQHFSVFSPHGDYFFAPEFQSEDEMIRFVDSLPDMDGPHVFGMHPNAHMSYQRQQGQEFVRLLLQLQPNGDNAIPRINESSNSFDTSGNHDIENVAVSTSQDILNKLPSTYAIETADALVLKRKRENPHDPLAVVLQQEMTACHKLLIYIHSNLEKLQQAVRGTAVMTIRMEQMLHSLALHQVPIDWIVNDSQATSTAQSLSQWMTSQLFRCDYLHRWAASDGVAGNAFPLSVFSFPQGLFTAILQRYARKHNIPIHYLDFQFRVLTEQEYAVYVEDIEQDRQTIEGEASSVDDGAYLTGLLLEGAQWHSDLKCLCSSQPGVMRQRMPMIYVLPQRNDTLATTSLIVPAKPATPNGSLENNAPTRVATKPDPRALGRMCESLRRLDINSRKSTLEGVSSSDSELCEVQTTSMAGTLSIYPCPVYRTTVRKGTLSTTGTSTNLVLAINLPCHGEPDYFVLNGTALVCSGTID